MNYAYCETLLLDINTGLELIIESNAMLSAKLDDMINNCKAHNAKRAAEIADYLIEHKTDVKAYAGDMSYGDDLK